MTETFLDAENDLSLSIETTERFKIWAKENDGDSLNAFVKANLDALGY